MRVRRVRKPWILTYWISLHTFILLILHVFLFLFTGRATGNGWEKERVAFICSWSIFQGCVHLILKHLRLLCHPICLLFLVLIALSTTFLSFLPCCLLLLIQFLQTRLYSPTLLLLLPINLFVNYWTYPSLIMTKHSTRSLPIFKSYRINCRRTKPWSAFAGAYRFYSLIYSLTKTYGIISLSSNFLG